MSSISIIITIAVFLAVAWFVPVCSGGYANTVKRICLAGYRHAERTQARQAARAVVVNRMWAQAVRAIDAVPEQRKRRTKPVPISKVGT